jgi:hypothetical protein
VGVETGKWIRPEESCTPGEEDGWWGPQWLEVGRELSSRMKFLHYRKKRSNSKSLHYRQGVYIEKNERYIINTVKSSASNIGTSFKSIYRF